MSMRDCRIRGCAVLLMLAAALAGWDRALADCDGTPQDAVYTLYRDSPLIPGQRTHVATFDSAEGEVYNRNNCLIARDLFVRQPGVLAQFWCERGRFKAT
jgi:hypothetical protein